MRVLTRAVVLAALGTTLHSCQDYPVLYQPDRTNEGVHVRFVVNQPSKADLLFVVDNSISMQQEQEALAAGMQNLLDFLAPTDTDYRIAITSTDVRGDQVDCCGAQVPPAAADDLEPRGGKGNCSRCNCGAGNCEVALRRPHDGARGRLIAAYDPGVFRLDATRFDGAPLFDLPPELEPVLKAAFPSEADEVPWVLDRQQVDHEACEACGCAGCDDDSDDSDDSNICHASCAAPVAEALVRATITSSLNGLGTSGSGWEAGIEAALKAVGIDPEDSNDATAPAPANSLIAPGGANRWQDEPWTRDDALLGVLLLTDEEDCSMPRALFDHASDYEVDVGRPVGSLCYQWENQWQLLDTDRMADLLLARKQSARRIVIGLIAGVQASSEEPVDCRVADTPLDEEPPTSCSCLSGAPPEYATGWCDFTQDSSGTPPTCDALAAHRYVDFARRFPRRVHDSVCRAGADAFGNVLREFAKMLLLPFFDLGEVRPAQGDASRISIYRTPVASQDLPPMLLPRIERADPVPPGGAWWYDEADNLVWLAGLQRIVGDRYDIFVLQTATP